MPNDWSARRHVVLRFTELGKAKRKTANWFGPIKVKGQRKISNYGRILHYVTLPRQRKIGVQWRLQGAIAGDHFYYKRERNTVLQLE